jgi:hypothetical protein
MDLLKVRGTRFLVAAFAALVLVGWAIPASAAPAQSFRAYGQGTEPANSGSTPPADCSSLPACPGSDACWCINVQGHGQTNVTGAASFTADVFTDIDQQVGQCLVLWGSGTIVEKDHPGQRIAVDFKGSECDVNSNYTMNAVYFVNGANSHGKWAGATGSGSITGSSDANYKILGSIIGTIRPQ